MIDTSPTAYLTGGAPVCGPAEVAGDASSIERMVGRWWVLHTRARNEKALATDLDERRISYFLPLARVQRRYGRRVVEVELPLFPGYLFMCGQEEDRYTALTKKRVANVLNV